ncbi:hypothetical protein F5Y16DRAFT_385355 [Xylariaceae sp. FL0255]|nr:hypothetical protein F5Y16DRAFT_385355 [Xylariaceae sp. FL0255]
MATACRSSKLHQKITSIGRLETCHRRTTTSPNRGRCCRRNPARRDTARSSQLSPKYHLNRQDSGHHGLVSVASWATTESRESKVSGSQCKPSSTHTSVFSDRAVAHDILPAPCHNVEEQTQENPQFFSIQKSESPQIFNEPAELARDDDGAITPTPTRIPKTTHEANLDAVSDEFKDLYEAYWEVNKDTIIVGEEEVSRAYWTWSKEQQQWYHKSETGSIYWYASEFESSHQREISVRELTRKTCCVASPRPCGRDVDDPGRECCCTSSPIGGFFVHIR